MEGNKSCTRIVESLIKSSFFSTSAFIAVIQATAWTMNPDGTTPMWSKVCKNLTIRRSRRDSMKEQDEVVSYISKQSDPHGFKFVITRPGSLVWDRQSQTKLAASKSVSESQDSKIFAAFQGLRYCLLTFLTNISGTTWTRSNLGLSPLRTSIWQNSH